MKLLALMLLAADVVAPSTISQVRGISDDGYIMAPEPEHWEGDVVCGNGATPKLSKPKGNRVHVVCAARKDGGR